MSDTFVSQGKQDELKARMDALGISEKDLVEKFILGSGKGGQKINKTASCVYIKHVPTGIEIKCQSARSRVLNRYSARRELCSRLDERIQGAKSERQQVAEKIRRQKRRRSRRQQANMLHDKHMNSGRKAARKRPGAEE
jgi:protein subunit release factor B